LQPCQNKAARCPEDLRSACARRLERANVSVIFTPPRRYLDMNNILADLHAERRARQGLPAEPPAPAAEEPPAPAVELPAPAVEAPAQDMDVDEAAPPPPNADDAASADDSVRSPDAVVVERLIDDEAPSVASSNGGPQCYVCYSSEVTEGNPLIAPCRCNTVIHEQCLRELQSRNLQDPGREQYAHNCQVCQAPYALAPPIIPSVRVKLVDQYQEALRSSQQDVEHAVAYALEENPEADEFQLREEYENEYGPNANEYDEDGNKLGECHAVTHVRATIRHEGLAVGRAALLLVDRELLARWSGARNSWDFHSAVAHTTESGTLYDIATTFFDADGTTPRLECLRAHGDGVGRGQFAYIEAFEIEAPADMDPRTDIATVALQQLRDLVGGWGCAAYVPDARTHLMPAELAACDDQPYFFGKYEKDPAKRQAAYDLARRGIRRDMTPFLRVGFHQVDEVLKECTQVSYLYCVDATWRAVPMSYDDASAPGLVMPAPPLPRPADATLSDFLSAVCTRARNPIPEATMRRVMTFIIQLVTQQGACVRKARALHYCAAHSQECPALAPLVELLCSIGGPEAINDADAGGCTPLMLAANNVGYDSPDLTMLRMFLACGADKSIAHEDDGLTALGYYRSRVRSRVAFCKGLPENFGWGSAQPLPKLNFEVEGLLMPSDGPTAADKAAYDELLGMFETRSAFYGAA
jgi:hypothetical protein